MLYDIDTQVAEVYAAFEVCGSIKEIDRQLAEGLVSKIEHARYVVQVWEVYKRLPQYREITDAFPALF